jgi:autotransporter strand-loop-strand O-heptosyltransferase
MNDAFRTTYPAIEFVEPGATVHDLYAMYRVGWFTRADGSVDLDRNVRDFRRQPLGMSATDILGLPFVETRPRLSGGGGPRPIEEPYVCIGVHATAQAKYWNNPTGWAEVTAFLCGQGYRVVLLSREGREYMGNAAPRDVTVLPAGPLDEVVRYLRHAAMFVGVGSGLTWLAWATGCRTCLVSGFSLPYSEMTDCIRVAPGPGVCTGCFNARRLDPDDWNWCPELRDTPRMFECTRTITGQDVIEALRAHL